MGRQQGAVAWQWNGLQRAVRNLLRLGKPLMNADVSMKTNTVHLYVHQRVSAFISGLYFWSGCGRRPRRRFLELRHGV